MEGGGQHPREETAMCGCSVCGGCLCVGVMGVCVCV